MPDGAPLFPACRTHLDELSDEMGIFQHAVGPRPDPRHGYCTDDVARALLVDLLHARELGWPAVESSVERGMRFLAQAFEPSTGRFRNFRRADGSWLDEPGSEDAHARALLALGESVAGLPDGRLLEAAGELFERALPAALQLGYVRPRAAVVLACDAADRGGLGAGALKACRSAADSISCTFGRAELDAGWPWPEPAVTYENGLPAQALVVAGRTLDRPEMIDLGLRLLDWLLEHETDAAGHLVPVGNRGWWPRGGAPARFDQQPIEATSLLLAAAAGYDASGNRRYLEAMEMAYAWYLGANDVGVAVAEPDRGAAFDGLTPAGVNENQGAESTLVWLMALEGTRRHRQSSGAPPAREPAAAATGAAR